jgi:hypothetical protein
MRGKEKNSMKVKTTEGPKEHTKEFLEFWNKFPKLTWFEAVKKFGKNPYVSGKENNVTKTMGFVEAVRALKSGKKITRKSWGKEDFLYMEDAKIFCDGGFSYQELLKPSDFLATDWILRKESKG